MKIDRALMTPGWMDPFELCWLGVEALHHSTIVEIGSFLGRSTRVLADNTPGVVYAIDDWLGPRDTTIDGEPVDFSGHDLFGEFIKNMEGAERTYRAIRCDHKDPQWSGNPDMVFIDGSHEYEDVKFDIQFWMPKIVSGGLICGHDSNKEGVAKAVIELLPTAKVVLGTKIWMLDLP